MTTKKYVEEQQQPFLKSLKELIAIPSVLEKGSEKEPFGKPINDALTKIIEISESLGFKTFRDPKNRYGYAEIGSGEEHILILGHIDVVPALDLQSWNTNPFEYVEKDGMIYGRGISDNKGPLLSSMFAVKALIDSKTPLKHKIRIMFGCDEETGWECVNAYKAEQPEPKYAFTPDSCFPLTYAEKTINQCSLTSNYTSNFKVYGGSAPNVVPASAFYEGSKVELIIKELEKLKYEYIKHSENKLEVTGISTHASTCDKGINAISRLAIAMYNVDEVSPSINFIANYIKETYNGELIFGQLEDKITGKPTLSAGIINIDVNGESLILDTRFGVTLDETIYDKSMLEKSAKYDLLFKVTSKKPSLYIPIESELVQKLMQAYQSCTGDMESKPQIMGGATYAKTYPDRCVAFGAMMPNANMTMHQANEETPVKDLFKAMEIYAEAIRLLAS